MTERRPIPTSPRFFKAIDDAGSALAWHVRYATLATKWRDRASDEQSARAKAFSIKTARGWAAKARKQWADYLKFTKQREAA